MLGDYTCTCDVNSKQNKSTHKIYKNFLEWYHPEIDYFEILENFRWTEDPYKKAVGRVTEYPRSDVMLLSHINGFDENRKQQIFQLWNKQCNDALAETIKKLNPTLILDVCAGDGMLPKILSDRGFNVVAADDYSWPFGKRYFDVHKMSYRKSLDFFQPDVVIGCWMPHGTDWTPSFRKTKSVKHYIQIGEGDNGCTGGNIKDRDLWPIHYDENFDKYALCRTDWLMYELSELTGYMNNHSGAYIASFVE
jgi:hypothetical protein